MLITKPTLITCLVMIARNCCINQIPAILNLRLSYNESIKVAKVKYLEKSMGTGSRIG